MRSYGSVAVSVHSGTDHGVPLPKATRSGRSVFDDLARVDAARNRLSPVQIQPLTADQTQTLQERTAKPAARRTPTSAPGRTRVDPAQIIALYLEGLTAPQVGERVGCSHTTVYKYLDDSGVARRNDRVTKRVTPRKRPEPGADVTAVIAAHHEGLTCPQIAARLGHAPGTIRAHLRAAGLVIPDARAGHSGGRNRRVDPPEYVARLRELYVDQGKSIRDTAALIGDTPKVILTSLIRNDIPRRPPVAQRWQAGAA